MKTYLRSFRQSEQNNVGSSFVNTTTLKTITVLSLVTQLLSRS